MVAVTIQGLWDSGGEEGFVSRLVRLWVPTVVATAMATGRLMGKVKENVEACRLVFCFKSGGPTRYAPYIEHQCGCAGSKVPGFSNIWVTPPFARLFLVLNICYSNNEGPKRRREGSPGGES